MIKKISIIAFLAILSLSCDINEKRANSCPVIIGVSTTKVSGPIATAIDEAIVLEVSYKTKKNCGGFSSFFKNPSTDPLVDIITTNTFYDACSCDEVVSVQKEPYTFKKSTPGIYIVKFKNTNETFIEHTVTVQ